MLVLGLQGSPRKNGNTQYLLTSFLKEAENLGAETVMVEVDKKHIVPCKEYIVCEKKGFCPIQDDMKTEIYPLLRKADVVVAATPVFFYNATAQLKALIDRTQTLWARKYRLNLTDPIRGQRKGFLLAVGATKGKNLFEGLHLTMRYFYDAVGAGYDGSLTYWKIEKPGDMAAHPGLPEDIRSAVRNLLKPLLSRKRVVFVDTDGRVEAQMAWAYTQLKAGNDIESQAVSAFPADTCSPVMASVMGEEGIDMEFRSPEKIPLWAEHTVPDRVVLIGKDIAGIPPGWREAAEIWDMPPVDESDRSQMVHRRDEIRNRVESLIGKTAG
jgi:multimeric flavodoxin WrbA